MSGWDDPRMPTISGLRRRGVPPEAIRALCKQVGVTKYEGVTDIQVFDGIIRDQLNPDAPRRMAVLRPLKVVITNYPEGQTEEIDAPNHPGDEEMGTRKLPFGREVWIDHDDFMEEPPKKYFRLAPGAEVRLRYAYNITCQEVVKNDAGEVVELRCTYDPESFGGGGNKVKGRIHWVADAGAIDAQVHLYDHLFREADPSTGEDWLENLNPDSLEIVQSKLEAGLEELAHGDRVQFERSGYFTPDPSSTAQAPVFNRIVALRDGWAKIQAKGN